MGSKEESYKEMKEFICTGCGKPIMLTKFASQKTCKCDNCKNNNVPVNPDIVAEALKKNPPKERKKSDTGDTKIRPCIKCGTSTEVSKFMSDQKVLCDTCKGVTSVKAVASNLKVDKSKLGTVRIAPIEEYEMNGGIIANRGLRELKCPSCGHEYMKPLMVVDWSQFGMIIKYQCQKCYTTIDLSEQTRRPIKIHSPGKRFDYTGTEVRELGISMKDSSRLANALCILIEKCERNNINIDDVFDNEFKQSLPPYKFVNDMPVEKGFKIPPEDEWVDTIHQMHELLKNAKRLGSESDDPEGNRWIQISDTLANQLADKLNKLLKGGKTNGEKQH